MPSAQERTPKEREKLIFREPEAAREFAERVDERVRRESEPGVKRQREVVAEEVAAEMDKYGEAAEVLSRPWEHTPEEHEEVQQLVDVAFEQDLPAALKQAREGKNYPRTIDLLHDVLTGEMYDLLVKRGLNRQPSPGWPVLAAGAVVVFLVLSLLFFMLG